jgi:hypothetical protein
MSGKKSQESQGLVAHTCDPNYSRGRDQQDGGSKPVLGQIVLETYLEKNSLQKKGW